jgi:hypothetical protein
LHFLILFAFCFGQFLSKNGLLSLCSLPVRLNVIELILGARLAEKGLVFVLFGKLFILNLLNLAFGVLLQVIL